MWRDQKSSKQTDTKLRSSYFGASLRNSPPFRACRAACFFAIAGEANRWTGDVFGVYPLYDVYDFARLGPLGLERGIEPLSCAWTLVFRHFPRRREAPAKEVVELDGIEPTT